MENICSPSLFPLEFSSSYPSTAWTPLAMSSSLLSPSPRPILHTCQLTSYSLRNCNLLWLFFFLQLSSLITTKHTANESISPSCHPNDVHPHSKLSCEVPLLPWEMQNFYPYHQTPSLMTTFRFSFCIPVQDRLTALSSCRHTASGD